jgi:hypothetical protein
VTAFRFEPVSTRGPTATLAVELSALRSPSIAYHVAVVLSTATATARSAIPAV